MTGKNLLLFGGTFNPIHNGHMITARHVFEELKDKFHFDHILLVPNGVAPHKPDPTEADHRLKMCQIAVEDDPTFKICDYESIKDGPSYTLETVVHFKESLKTEVDKIYVLIGLDEFFALPSWYKIAELNTLCTFIVMYDSSSPSIFQDGFPMVDFYLNIWNSVSPFKNSPIYRTMKDTIFILVPRIDIRATLIRDRIKKRLSVNYFLPPAVELYIMEHNLYL